MIDRIRKAQDDDSGFTLIELLVVVIIIGILAAIAIPVFMNQRESARQSAAESDVRNAAIAVETHYTEEQSYPGTIGDIEVEESAGVDLSLTVGTADGVEAFCVSADHTDLNGNPNAVYDSSQGGLTDDESCNVTP